ncbi:MAG: hypothetical protein AAFO07_25675, partial [Bacteroidota bacterium]
VSIAFSMFMIVFEIVLGIMLIIGAFRKITAWSFFLLVFFFTFLTGFTYLTGYVPEGVNFFQFANWGPYVETNMKVTDCGCFGDFIKLQPKTSFFKDVFLLFPAVVFLLATKSMHQLFKTGTNLLIMAVATVALIVYGMSNYKWNLPHTDFRPFKEGVNVTQQKEMEDEAVSSITVTAYKLKNRESGKVIEIPFNQYLKEYKNYPKEEWESEQVKTEPEIPITKISEFEVTDITGSNVTDDILYEPGYSMIVIANKLYGESENEVMMVQDTIMAYDTIRPEDGSPYLTPRIDDIVSVEKTVTTYDWEDYYVDRWKEKVVPIMADAQTAGSKVFGITAPASEEEVRDFRNAIGAEFPIFTADDILLKTIIRSNPGVLLMHNGTILKKWHISKLPDSFESIKENYYNQ